MCLIPQILGVQSLGSASWNDLRSRRRSLGWASALQSLISDSMPAVLLQAPACICRDKGSVRTGSGSPSHCGHRGPSTLPRTKVSYRGLLGRT